MIKKAFLTQILIMLTLHLSGCTSNVNVDYDKSVSFSPLKSYRILPKSEKSTGDTRLDSPLVDQRIESAIHRVLAQKSLRRDDNNPDILVKYQLDLKMEIDSRDSGVSIMMGTGTRSTGIGFAYSIPGSSVESHDRGVLTIDFLASGTSQLIWRGSSSRRLYESGTPETNEKLVNSIVEEILAVYPPR